MGTDIHLSRVCSYKGGEPEYYDPVVVGYIENDLPPFEESLGAAPMSSLWRERIYFVFAQLAGVRVCEPNWTGLFKYELQSENWPHTFNEGDDYDGGHSYARLSVSEMDTAGIRWDLLVNPEDSDSTVRNWFGWYYSLFQQLEKFCQDNNLDPAHTYLEYWFDN